MSDANETSRSPAPGDDELPVQTGTEYPPDAWREREQAVLALALSISLDELKESAKPFESLKTRGITLFAAVSASVAFLLGSALSNFDPESYNYVLLNLGVGSYIAFGITAFLMLRPGERNLYLDGLKVRNQYVQGPQDCQASHVYEFDQVQWELIKSADTRIIENIVALKKLRNWFLMMLVSATLCITFLGLFVAFADPRNGAS